MKFLGNLLWFMVALAIYPLGVAVDIFEKNPFARANYIVSESFKLLLK